MSTLQDEMAALNHRLDHKLDTLRRLRRLHKTIALYLAYVLWLCLAASIGLLFFHQQTLRANGSLFITIFLSVTPPLIYCCIMRDIYHEQLAKGQALKGDLYSSFLNDEASRDNAIQYLEQLEKINW
jgi:multisubunit Na+/H+ antiporter MnhG subunit